MKKKMRGFSFWRAGLIFLAACFAVALCLDYVYVGRKIGSSPSSVQAPARAVLRAHMLKEYWENELYIQKAAIDKLALSEQVAFYAIIAMHCDLTNYRANYFEELAAPVGEVLLVYLQEVAGSNAYDGLSDESKLRIRYWIDRLPTVIEERDFEKTRPKSAVKADSEANAK